MDVLQMNDVVVFFISHAPASTWTFNPRAARHFDCYFAKNYSDHI